MTEIDFGISQEDIERLLFALVLEFGEEYRKHIVTKDENALCLNLDIINTSLEDWYTDIIAKFSPWVENDMKVESSEVKVIYDCARNPKRRSIAERSLEFLKYMEALYKSPKLKNGIKQHLDIDKINKTKKSLDHFYSQTVQGKDDWLEAAMNKQQFSRKRVIDWHKELDKDRKVIDESLSSVKFALKCQPITDEQIRDYGL